MNMPNKLMFIFFLISGTLMVLSSSTWFMVWMSLEINMMSFIPMLSSLTLLSAEATLKYFLTQTIASIILLFSVIFNLTMTNFQGIDNFILPSSSYFIEVSLLLKLGAAPFHFWFPQVAEGLNWPNCLILLTWQKIAPLFILSMLNSSAIILVSIMLSAISGSLLGLNQLLLRKIIIFSSINHMSWMLAAMIMSSSSFILYFIIYSLLSSAIIIVFYFFKLHHLNQLYNSSHKLITLMIISFLFFSLGGLPPFLGFFPKWVVLNNLMSNSFYSISFLLIMTALITLLYYIRMSYSMLFLFYSTKKWTFNFSIPKIPTILLMMMSLLTLPLTMTNPM